MPRTPDAVDVPLGYPTSTFFVDESGSKATASQFFVVAAIKVREPGLLAREVQHVRDLTGERGELKFSEITQRSMPVYFELIKALERSDAHISACVVDGRVHNPFTSGKEVWEVHAQVTAQLIAGCTNRRELVAVLLDAITTPRGQSLEEAVRRDANRRLGATGVVSAVCLDSRTNDLLQLADLVASSIFHERRRLTMSIGKATSPKGRVAGRLGATFGRPDLTDGRQGRVNIQTYRGRRPRKTATPDLRAV